MARLSLLALVLLASGCTDSNSSPTAASADSTGRAVAIAESLAAAYQTAAAAGDGSASCAEATAAAESFKKAGREAESLLWQNMAETACLALQPQIDATLARISDSLATAK